MHLGLLKKSPQGSPSRTELLQLRGKAVTLPEEHLPSLSEEVVHWHRMQSKRDGGRQSRD